MTVLEPTMKTRRSTARFVEPCRQGENVSDVGGALAMIDPARTTPPRAHRAGIAKGLLDLPQGAQAATLTASFPLRASEAQVRERAYQIYLKRNGAVGDAIGDWLQAERELTHEHQRQSPARRRTAGVANAGDVRRRQTT
jgi:hypothetical protein